VARAYARLNTSPLLGDVVVEAPQFNAALPAVTVSARTTVPTSLLRLAGINALALSAQARAARSNIEQTDKDQNTPGKSRLTQ
jgi:hypothetical protein